MQELLVPWDCPPIAGSLLSSGFGAVYSLEPTELFFFIYMHEGHGEELDRRLFCIASQLDCSTDCVYFCFVLCLPCGFCSRVAVSVFWCSLRPRHLYLRRKASSVIWLYWMVMRVEKQLLIYCNDTHTPSTPDVLVRLVLGEQELLRLHSCQLRTGAVPALAREFKGLMITTT